MRFTKAIAAVAMLSAGLVASIPGAASAAPDDSVPVRKIERQMQTVQVLSVTESGDQYVLSLANGREISLSAKDYARWSKSTYGAEALARIANGGISTNNQTVGNCGMEYLYLYSAGHRELRVDTGWRLVNSVIVSQIWVDIYDNGGHTERYYGTSWDDGAWDVSETLRNMTSGIARGWVDPASYATLVDGRICYTLMPSSEAMIR
ncbi:hypothetical protein Kfla_2163 [Kribbella flavida DSM 17836]|uniref:Uncharacterized protein n=1 Tax=Kribbella flavida (strain DSM 17836 / JCM 10339 / NBRC 14399) TaxID=479435 RepID=D2PSC1_KRIFD|nr:hypothetical protein [Kribbella flavida]ADB31245.1 hypothetical protein Kfla_2163 [Kribbella flavida DSM 17836]